VVGARDEYLQSAERASRIAMELAPDLADAHVARGCTLALQGRYEEAKPNFEAAARINPSDDPRFQRLLARLK
jgi:tetratricopeptide (TPR) repeat protein